MDDVEKAKELLKNRNYLEAAELIENSLKKNENDELWYLRGIISLKLKSYDYAHECFETAYWINKKPEYLKTDGMAYMEMLEVEEAIEKFKEANEIKEDAEHYFFIAVCYMFLNDDKSKEFLKKAYEMNKDKTVRLLKDFFNSFFRDNPEVGQKTKEMIEEKIDEYS
ncbi:MAG TPA: hypothetical protein VI912_01250 [Candidatus Bilamarchaeaceae archaeon]|nr:hypothetical protein [Candidatus Bilamarchaeaceae archaeon]